MSDDPKDSRGRVDLLRRGLLAGLVSSVAGAALAKAPATSPRPVPRAPGFRQRSAPEAGAIIAGAGLSGEVSYLVADADSGEVLEARQPLLPQPPASVAKAITALYALEALGPAFRFRTRLLGTGPIENGLVAGDLVLAGGGDPTLDTDGLAALAQDLRAAGVRGVRGRFLIHAGGLPQVPMIDPGQPDFVDYNPAVSGLNLNFNRVYFEWRQAAAGYDVSMDARSATLRPAVRSSRMQVVERAAPVYTYEGRAGRDDWTVARGALGKAGGRWLPVRRPDLYAAEVFQTIAGGLGIRLPAPEVSPGLPTAAVLALRSSAPLSEVLADMLLYSTNLTAEVVGATATARRDGAAPASLAGSAARMTEWLHRQDGIGAAGFVDHSGLGDASRISAQEMAAALRDAGWDGPLRPLLKPLRFTDSRGRAIPGHPLEVVAKTGTLNFVSGLAGYLRAPAGRRLVFAIFSADLPRRDAIPREAREAPEGARPWAVRARRMQQALLDRWGIVHDL
jgi:D-alanyl-D-alanine carboxypeptidase/D-alanyl-D-alanine-endopeptidase (penicillin-binding protein 4)